MKAVLTHVKNKFRKSNQALIHHLVSKEGYMDLGWAHEGEYIEIPKRAQIFDCSEVIGENTHLVYVDNINKEVLHVDKTCEGFF